MKVGDTIRWRFRTPFHTARVSEIHDDHIVIELSDQDVRSYKRTTLELDTEIAEIE